ncbi:MAG TPA: transporter substrate-binding domain-containing protein [Spongiibacteraceae bacterium]|nr:transporter substrate-binding domain-containing protein [Spongiibacteraceae bacterium]
MRKLLDWLWLFSMWVCWSTALAAADAPLRVGTAADTPPLAFQQDGKVIGMEADFAKLLQTQLGRPLQFQILPAAELLPALQRGDIDMVMSGLVITDARAQQVDFVQPYLQAGQMAIIRIDDVLRFRSPASLLQGGFRAGFVVNSPGAEYVKAQMSAATAVPCANAEECLQSLLSKRIDVFVDAASTSWLIATQPRYGALLSFYRPLTEEPLAWAVNKSNGQLRERLDAALQSMRQTPMFEHILNRWIPVRVAND